MKTINSIDDYQKMLRENEEVWAVSINNRDAVYFTVKGEAINYLNENKLSNVDTLVKVK